MLLLDDLAEVFSAYILCAAASITAEDVCFMVNHGGGVVCAALSEERIKELGLPMMSTKSEDVSPDFTVSVEARQGVTTGISAADRARTLRRLAKTDSPKRELVTPGHIFPIRAKQGGVLVRNTPAEAAVDILTLSGLNSVAALCHCLDENGEISQQAEIERLLNKTGIPCIAISDIIRERLAHESIIEAVAEAVLPTKQAGEFKTYCFRSRTDKAEHIALIKGDIASTSSDGSQIPLLTRVQAENPVCDLLDPDQIPSRSQLHTAMKEINKEGRGLLIYVRRPQVETPHHFLNLLSEHTSTQSLESVSDLSPLSSLREYGIGAQILSYLGVKKVRLLTNSKRDISGITAFQIEIVERVAF